MEINLLISCFGFKTNQLNYHLKVSILEKIGFLIQISEIIVEQLAKLTYLHKTKRITLYYQRIKSHLTYVTKLVL
ncbi:protein of unknown function [Candidatus Nitrosocosmicus franklandus]|uniref:Uncharacterized protein n=1 Tax=Candidatus Nitrosocosmicus franklandianus TaxID=1798806 RepID=A0A484I5D0_9ARCH|nr:protein of unknown function [Candidatus Nitrosocosmicus franklandus]